MRSRTRIRKSGFQSLNGQVVGTQRYGTISKLYGSFAGSTSLLRFDKCNDQLNPGPPYHTGGEFVLYSADVDDVQLVGGGHHMFTMQLGGPNYYDGGFYPNMSMLNGYLGSFTETDFTKSYHSSNFDLSPYNASMWHSAAPGNPGVDLAVAIHDLRDVPGMLRDTAKGFHSIWKSMGGAFRHWSPKHVASQFLNEQFGWKPFLGDCYRYLKTVNHINDGLARARHDNGQWVHRRRVLGTVSSSGMLASGKNYPAGASPTLITYGYKSQGNYEIWKETTADRWFEGSFKYYVPDIDTKAFERRYILHTLGLKPTPAMIWEMIPWSWLYDWGTNIGDVLSNISNQTLGWTSNLVSRNAFAMGTVRNKYTLKSTVNISDGPVYVEGSATAVWKRRQLANPFGFAANWSSLSTRQFAILAALGISR